MRLHLSATILCVEDKNNIASLPVSLGSKLVVYRLIRPCKPVALERIVQKIPLK